MVFKWLLNEKTTLRRQILVSYLLMTVTTVGITLLVAYLLIYSLGSQVKTQSNSIILEQSYGNCEDIASEIASAIDQQLRIVAESICMVGAEFAETIIPYSDNYGNGVPLLREIPSYREYNFVEGCEVPECPSDFGNLISPDKTRFPYDPGTDFQMGSMSDSSVFMFASSEGRALRDDVSWDNYVGNDSSPWAINSVINGLQYNDLDMRVSYKSVVSTVMFYYSALIPSNNGQYTAVHRTYPGIKKNATWYDPSKRSWFVNAPIDGFALSAPYTETFTRQKVVTVSSKKLATLPGYSQPITVVAAATMLIQNFTQILNTVEYPDSGFAALLKNSRALEVLAWGSEDVYDSSTQQFKTIVDFAPTLGSYAFADGASFEYVDSSGQAWLVASSMCFDSYLILLVFFVKDEAVAPLIYLNDHVDSTTQAVTVGTIIVAAVTVTVIMLLVLFVVWYLTAPLERMQRLSSDIAKLSAMEERLRDYSAVVELAREGLGQFGELGSLASDYYEVVSIMHRRNERKKAEPKYPANALHLSPPSNAGSENNYGNSNYGNSNSSNNNNDNDNNGSNSSNDYYRNLSWPVFMAQQTAKKVQPSAPPSETSNGGQEDNAALDVESATIGSSSSSNSSSSNSSNNNESSPDELDVLGSITTLADVGPTPPADAKNTVKVFPAATTGHDEELCVKSINPIIEEEQTLHPSSFDFCLHTFMSLKMQLSILSLFMICGLIVIVLITMLHLRADADGWMSESSVEIETKQVQSITTITSAKAVYVDFYFRQQSLDLSTAANFATNLLDRNLTDADWLSKNQYRESFSADINNNYGITPATVNTKTYSAYFSPYDKDCAASSTCDETQATNITRLTSLFDLKLRSYFHNNSQVSFVQFGEEGGLTRYFQGVRRSDLAEPTSCQISSTKTPDCLAKYQSSSCSSTTYTTTGYPAYDVRCRSWYQNALELDSPQSPYFDLPRISSAGTLVITSAVELRTLEVDDNRATVGATGALSFNQLASNLVTRMNALTVLSSGYAFLIQINGTGLVSHPSLTAKCKDIQCAEKFNDAEFSTFKAVYIAPLIDDATVVSGTGMYYRNGQQCRLTFEKVQVGNVDYCLFVTVPQDDVMATSVETQKAIDSTTDTLLSIFIVFTIFFAFVIVYITNCLSATVVGPIVELRSLLQRIKTEDLTGEIPHEAQSLDMRALLDAFARLLIALRFGDDMYARESPVVALEVFSEALALFESTGNEVGIGASLSNLAATHLSLGNFTEAEDLCKRSIAHMERLLSELQQNGVSTGPSQSGGLALDASRCRRTLSDRKGNLSVVYLEAGRFAEAFELIEALLVSDKQDGYIRGCVVKQAALAQYYLRQKEFKSAEKILNSSVTFVQRKGAAVYSESADWDAVEASGAEQIALYGVACLLREMGCSADAVEAAFLEVCMRTMVLPLQQWTGSNLNHLVGASSGSADMA